MWKPDREQEARILSVGGSLLAAVRWAWDIDGEMSLAYPIVWPPS